MSNRHLGSNIPDADANSAGGPLRFHEWLVLTYAASTGRNVHEIQRVMDSLQTVGHTAGHANIARKAADNLN